ncbi:MAG TPA: DUF47 domain-containing protein [Candidatus Choladousia intestinigallinarum]|nr:DUF47 domain-containing protein [Candidatus Choladousia intestinigallinarum]
MSKKQDSFYFETFIACAEDSCEAAYMIKNALKDFRPDELRGKLDELHEIEHRADEKKHRMLDRLAKEFIPPIEREDIITLGQNIDEITDKLEDVLLRVYMNHVEKIEPEALEMMDVIIKCCEGVRDLTKEFADFKHSKGLKNMIIEINALEESADSLFVSSMRKLHTESRDPLHIIAWREIYTYLEKCADACEHTADTVESVVMKNS